MLKNYIKIAFRNLLRDTANTVINLLGLAIALLCCIVIFVFVSQELTYDRFHQQADNIYRLTLEEVNRPGARYFATTSPPMGPALVESFPEIEKAVRFRFVDSNVLQYKDRQFYEYDVAYADSTFLTMFDFPLERGDRETALDEVNSVILTHRMAQKYFGEADPIGKAIELDNTKTLTVTGVFRPITQNTHLKFDCIISFDSFEVPMGYPVTLGDWGWVSFYTYVQLAEGTDPKALEAKFANFLVQNMGEDIGGNRILHLQPLKEVYLSPNLQNATVDLLTGNIGYTYGMIAVAVFLLLIACFNFMNLTTAQSIRRAREVGIRKSLGASRSSLFRQFVGESLLMSMLSVTIALLFIEPMLGYASSFLGLSLTIQPGDYLFIIPIFLGMGLVVGILAGIYPALVLSGFKPSRVLKGATESPGKRFDLRKVLVVAQFAIAILLISGSFIIREQIQFIQSKNLGFEEDQVVVLHMDGRELTRRYHTIRQQIEQNPQVVSAGMGGGLLDGNNGSVPIFTEDTGETEGYPMNIYGVHFGYFETMGVKLVEGRLPSEHFATDSASAIVLNGAAVKTLGWKHPIGKKMRISDIKKGRVIGVVRDFHFASLHREIQPLVMYIPPTNMENLFVRLRPGNMSRAIASLEETWRAAVPDFPFQFFFLDEHLNSLYQTDRRFYRLVTIFTLLTIMVACLGLYGLISYFIQRRTKEIGIRKVLGASIPQITFLLSKRFLLLVLIANIIAWPAAWVLMRRWLQNFAYQVDFGLGVFLVSGLLAVAVAWLTMSYQSLKAARMNPVDSLKVE